MCQSSACRIRTRRFVSGDERGIDEADSAFIMNPFDAIALEEALRIRERLSKQTEVLAIGISPDGYEDQLREALAMGTDRAILVPCTDPLDPTASSLSSAQRIQRMKPKRSTTLTPSPRKARGSSVSE